MTKEHEALKLARKVLGEDRAWLESDAPQRVWDANSNAVIAIDEALAQPEPPPECQTETEKTAFAFGWWKAMEAQRKPLTDEQWQVMADTLNCLITRSQKDIIEAALGIKGGA